MPTRDEAWTDGTPCWVDCQVDDIAAAKEYYAALFGWDFQAGPAETMGYVTALLGGRAVAGIGPKPEGVEMPAVWSTYISSSDVDATVERAKQAGATFGMEPTDVLEFGRMAFGEDPSGAGFGIWQAKQNIGVAVFREPNTLGWNELHTRDVDAVKTFYTAVFDWEYEDIAMEEMAYVLFKRPGDDESQGGIFLDTMMPSEAPAHWLVWFAVADCDESTSKATGLGSTELMPPMDSPYGRMAVVQAPQGESFGLIDPLTTVGEPTTTT